MVKHPQWMHPPVYMAAVIDPQVKHRLLAKIPLLLGIIFLLFAVIFLYWRLIPARTEQAELNLPAGVLPASPQGKPISLENDLELRLSYPSRVRAGEKAILVLDVTPNTSTGKDDTSASQGAMAVELSIRDMQLAPQGMVLSVYDPLQPKSFSWELDSQAQGMRNGSLWLSMLFAGGNDQQVEVALAEWDIQIEVIRLWGMNSATVTWLAMLALISWGGMMALGVKLEQDLKMRSPSSLRSPAAKNN